MNFNPSQIQAINHISGPALILAGPGSGKTTVMLSRINNLINSGVKPGNILAVTFSKAAATEMQERFEKKYAGNSAPTFGTFHSIFLKILALSSQGQNAKIISDRQKLFFIRSEIERYSLPSADENELAAAILNEISKVKSRSNIFSGANGNGPSEIGQMNNVAGLPNGYFQRIYASYERRKSAAFLIDFDDIILKCHRLLSDNPEILQKCQEKYKYLCIDEFQDISPAQYETISLIAGSVANIFAVGDDDQSIYGFRGSSPEMMQRFLKDYPNAARILLNVNYRCSPSIVKASLHVIDENKHRFHKSISSGVSYSDAQPARILPFPDRVAQFNSICEEVRDFYSPVKEKCGFLCENSEDFNPSIAVLFRNNSDVLLFIQILNMHRIPFSYHGKTSGLFDSFIFRDILCYLKLAKMFKTETTSGMRASLLPIINKPTRFILRDSLKMADSDCFKAMRRFYAYNQDMLERITGLENHLRFLSGLSPFAQIKYICKVIGYERYLKELANDKHIGFDEYEDVIGQIEEYAGLFENTGELIKNTDNLKDSNAINCGKQLDTYTVKGREAQYKNSLSEMTYNKINDREWDFDGTKPINIMTIHASKGLEYDIVYMPDVNENILPYSRSLRDGNLEEERRLFYVGMTRAKKHLRISYCESRNSKKAAPSRFLGCLME